MNAVHHDDPGRHHPARRRAPHDNNCGSGPGANVNVDICPDLSRKRQGQERERAEHGELARKGERHGNLDSIVVTDGADFRFPQCEPHAIF
jgi:hypothetical protein